MTTMNKCKYVDFIQDARVAQNNMIVMLYDGVDCMRVRDSPYLEYGLSDFKYAFDLDATYRYFAQEYLVAAKRSSRDTLLTDLKLYANAFRKFADKWFSAYTETSYFAAGWGGETTEMSNQNHDAAMRSICVENISTLTQLADKMIFVYTILNSYPVNADDEIDANNVVRWTHGDLAEPSRKTLYPIPISVLKFVAMVNDYRANFATYYAAYRARYVGVFKTVAASFNLES
nr:Hypothetical protein FSTVLC9_367 [Faustovirus]